MTMAVREILLTTAPPAGLTKAATPRPPAIPTKPRTNPNSWPRRWSCRSPVAQPSHIAKWRHLLHLALRQEGLRPAIRRTRHAEGPSPARHQRTPAHASPPHLHTSRRVPGHLTPRRSRPGGRRDPQHTPPPCLPHELKPAADLRHR